MVISQKIRDRAVLIEGAEENRQLDDSPRRSIALNVSVDPEVKPLDYLIELKDLAVCSCGRRPMRPAASLIRALVRRFVR